MPIAPADKPIDFEDASRLADEINAATGGSRILIVPGFGNSGPEHWQTYWQKLLQNASRVEQRDWNSADKDEWVGNYSDALDEVEEDGIYLVGHSLGTTTIAHEAKEHAARPRPKIRGALLVAPSDMDVDYTHLGIRGFDPMPLQPLPFDSVVVASVGDPYVQIDRAKTFAGSWGSRFKNIGKRGHINSESGLGPWVQGLRFFRDLVKRK